MSLDIFKFYTKIVFRVVMAIIVLFFKVFVILFKLFFDEPLAKKIPFFDILPTNEFGGF